MVPLVVGGTTWSSWTSDTDGSARSASISPAVRYIDTIATLRNSRRSRAACAVGAASVSAGTPIARSMISLCCEIRASMTASVMAAGPSASKTGRSKVTMTGTRSDSASASLSVWSTWAANAAGASTAKASSTAESLAARETLAATHCKVWRTRALNTLVPVIDIPVIAKPCRQAGRSLYARTRTRGLARSVTPCE